MPLNAEKIILTSGEQRIVDALWYECSDAVTVRYGDRFLIFADKVSYNKTDQTLFFPEHQIQPITIQNGEYLITAHSGHFNGKKNEAEFNDVEVHTGSEIITAHKAYKDALDTWRFDDVLYTPCSCKKAHWGFSAAHAKIQKNKLCSLTSPRAVFHQDVKVWLPSVTVGLVGSGGQSGFLFPVPRIHGGGDFSLYQAYYFNINPAVDTTVGVFARKDQGVMLDQELRVNTDHAGCFTKIYGGRLRHAEDGSITPFWGWVDTHASYIPDIYRSVVADVGYGVLGHQPLFFHDQVPRADEASAWVRLTSPLYQDARIVGQFGGGHSLRYPKALAEQDQSNKEAFFEGLIYSSTNYYELGNLFVSSRFETEYKLSQKNIFNTLKPTVAENAFEWRVTYAPTVCIAEDMLSGEVGISAGAIFENKGTGIFLKPLVTVHANLTERLAEKDVDNGMFAFEVGGFLESSTPYNKVFRLAEKRYLFIRGVRDIISEDFFSTIMCEQRFSFTKNASTQTLVSSDWQGENWHAYVHVLADCIMPRIQEVEWHCLFKPAKTFCTGLVGRYISTELMKKEYAKNRLKTMWHNRLTLGDNKISTELNFAQRKYNDGLLYPQAYKVTLQHLFDCWSWSVGYQYERFLEEESTGDWAFFLRISFGEHIDVGQKVSW